MRARQLDEWMAEEWPGNVRELRNAVDRLCLGVVVAAPIHEPGAGLVARVELYERQLIEAALRSCAGNVSAAAEALEIPARRSTTRSSGTAWRRRIFVAPGSSLLGLSGPSAHRCPGVAPVALVVHAAAEEEAVGHLEAGKLARMPG